MDSGERGPPLPSPPARLSAAKNLSPAQPDRGRHQSARRGGVSDTYQLYMPNALFFSHLESSQKLSWEKHWRGGEREREWERGRGGWTELGLPKCVPHGAAQRKIPARRVQSVSCTAPLPTAHRQSGIFNFRKMREGKRHAESEWGEREGQSERTARQWQESGSSYHTIRTEKRFSALNWSELGTLRRSVTYCNCNSNSVTRVFTLADQTSH